jgi:hypothetical protein
VVRTDRNRRARLAGDTRVAHRVSGGLAGAERPARVADDTGCWGREPPKNALPRAYAQDVVAAATRPLRGLVLFLFLRFPTAHAVGYPCAARYAGSTASAAARVLTSVSRTRRLPLVRSAPLGAGTRRLALCAPPAFSAMKERRARAAPQSRDREGAATEFWQRPRSGLLAAPLRPPRPALRSGGPGRSRLCPVTLWRPSPFAQTPILILPNPFIRHCRGHLWL